MVIASPTTGTETTDALTIFNLTQKSQKPQIFLFEATIFREFREFCVTFLLSHTHLSSLTTNLHVSSRIFLFLSRLHTHSCRFERFVVFHRRNSWLLSRPHLFVSIREIRGFNNYFDTTFSVISVVSVCPNPDEHPCYPR